MMTHDLRDAARRLAATTVDSRVPTQDFSATTLMHELGVPAVPTPAHRQGDAAGETTGDALGRFRVGEELGTGGMGRVVEAHDPELLRTVAVKTLLDPGEVSPERLARFVAEAQITAQLDHPNIVPIHDFGVTAEGELYIVMKRVRGLSLRQIIDAIAVGDPEAVATFSLFRLLMQFVPACGAMGYAHAQGVLHRDLKPDNLMFGPFGEVMVMDWGIARLMGDATESLEVDSHERYATTRTLDGATIGTPGYMSPEQARGEIQTMDARSDVWSLGAILYEVLTLQKAYSGTNPFSVLMQTVEGPPVDPRERAPDRKLDDEIAEVCMRAMSPDPADRLDDALLLAQAVGGYLEGQDKGDDECEAIPTT